VAGDEERAGANPMSDSFGRVVARIRALFAEPEGPVPIVEGELRIGIRADERSEAREAGALLEALGAREVKTRQMSAARGVGDIPTFVVGAVLAVTALSDLYERCRKNRLCREYVFVGRDELEIQRDCSVKDGRIIFIWSGGERVEIQEVPPGIDVTRVVEAVLKTGAEAAKVAAESVGAKVKGPYRPSDEPPDQDS
jgi:hypothetical protein